LFALSALSRKKFLGQLSIVSAKLGQRRLLLRVSAEFFHFVYGALLSSRFFPQTLAFSLIALPLLAQLFLLAFVESRSTSWHMASSRRS
jgi:hypothetical protein